MFYLFINDGEFINSKIKFTMRKFWYMPSGMRDFWKKKSFMSYLLYFLSSNYSKHNLKDILGILIRKLSKKIFFINIH